MGIGEGVLMMDYPCSAFGGCTFSRFGFIVQTNRQTNTQTDAETDADERFTPATVAGVSNQGCLATITDG